MCSARSARDSLAPNSARAVPCSARMDAHRINTDTKRDMLQHDSDGACHLDWQMLCREQRTALTTAKHRSQWRRDRHQVVQTLASSESPSSSSTTSSQFASCDTQHGLYISTSARHILPDSISVSRTVIERTRSTRRNYYPKFGEVFAWVCLISLVQSSLAAPQRSHVLKRSMNNTLSSFWINPCGTDSSAYSDGGEMEDSIVNDHTFYDPIVLQTKLALSSAEEFKESYVNKTFKLNFNDHHSSWKKIRYQWLPALPKQLDEKVPEDHLKMLQSDVNSALVNIYRDLQIFAVGLEQVSEDQRKNNGSFNKLFNAAKYQLKSLLCEIQEAIITRGAKRHEDVSRNVMDEELRNLNMETDRNVRDWIIYRDYLNALQYTKDVFEYLQSKSQ